MWQLGLVEARSGKLTAGIARLRQSLTQIEEMGFRNQLPPCLSALAEATLAAGWLLALAPLVERHGVPRTPDGRFVPCVTVGMGKLGGRELTTETRLRCRSRPATHCVPS